MSIAPLASRSNTTTGEFDADRDAFVARFEQVKENRRRKAWKKLNEPIDQLPDGFGYDADDRLVLDMMGARDRRTDESRQQSQALLATLWHKGVSTQKSQPAPDANPDEVSYDPKRPHLFPSRCEVPRKVCGGRVEPEEGAFNAARTGDGERVYAWASRDRWIENVVELVINHHPGLFTATSVKVSAQAFRAVMRAQAYAADVSSGRYAELSKKQIAERTGYSKRLVGEANRVAREAGILVELLPGRMMNKWEKQTYHPHCDHYKMTSSYACVVPAWALPYLRDTRQTERMRKRKERERSARRRREQRKRKQEWTRDLERRAERVRREVDRVEREGGSHFVGMEKAMNSNQVVTQSAFTPPSGGTVGAPSAGVYVTPEDDRSATVARHGDGDRSVEAGAGEIPDSSKPPWDVNPQESTDLRAAEQRRRAPDKGFEAGHQLALNLVAVMPWLRDACPADMAIDLQPYAQAKWTHHHLVQALTDLCDEKGISMPRRDTIRTTPEGALLWMLQQIDPGRRPSSGRQSATAVEAHRQTMEFRRQAEERRRNAVPRERGATMRAAMRHRQAEKEGSADSSTSEKSQQVSTEPSPAPSSRKSKRDPEPGSREERVQKAKEDARSMRPPEWLFRRCDPETGALERLPYSEELALRDEFTARVIAGEDPEVVASSMAGEDRGQPAEASAASEREWPVEGSVEGPVAPRGQPWATASEAGAAGPNVRLDTADDYQGDRLPDPDDMHVGSGELNAMLDSLRRFPGPPSRS